jgi:hypothetical protein
VHHVSVHDLQPPRPGDDPRLAKQLGDHGGDRVARILRRRELLGGEDRAVGAELRDAVGEGTADVDGDPDREARIRACGVAHALGP